MPNKSFPSIKTGKNTDPFSPSFEPYIVKTKGFYAYNYYKKKKEYIPNHYSIIEKYGVQPVDFRKQNHVELFNQMKRKKRVFVD